jgi:hypothetical protein
MYILGLKNTIKTQTSLKELCCVPWTWHLCGHHKAAAFKEKKGILGRDAIEAQQPSMAAKMSMLL